MKHFSHRLWFKRKKDALRVAKTIHEFTDMLIGAALVGCGTGLFVWLTGWPWLLAVLAATLLALPVLYLKTWATSFLGMAADDPDLADFVFREGEWADG